MTEIEERWLRITRWLSANAPYIAQSLGAGATGEEIKEAETALGVEFPSDFVTAYQTHNGQQGYSRPLLVDWELYTLEEIVAEWQGEMELFDAGEFEEANEVVEPQGPVRKEWWNPRWIPFAGNSSGDYYCLDLAPAEGGQVGQIIEFWHADERRRVIAASFSKLLTAFAADLEAGEYIVDDDRLKPRNND